jgi:4-amino-4-deoxy-L-arabinose transferase-like glycosyltransferase
MKSAELGHRSPETGRIATALALLVILVVAVCLRLAAAPIPLERDEGEYAYIGWRWLQGAVPYLDSFNQKTPGSFAVYALAMYGFGPSPTALHWGIQLYNLATLVLIFWLGLRLFGLAEAFVAALLACLLMVDPSLFGNAANTETLAMLPLAAGTIAALRASEGGGWGRCALAGALGATALLFKPQVAPIVIFHFLAIAAVRSRWLATAWSFALGSGLVLGLAILYFWLEGALWAMWDATVRFNLRYAVGVRLASYPAMLTKQMAPTLPTLWPIYLAVLLGLVTPQLGSPPAARSAGRTPPNSRRSWLWVAAWLGASLVAAALGGWFRRHYFHLVIPPASLMAAVGVRALLGGLFADRTARALSAGVALAIVALCVHGSWWYYGPGSPTAKSRRLYGANPFAESPALGAFLASHSQPRERIFVYGSEPQVLFYAQRESASRYNFVYALNLPFDEARDRQREVLQELAARPPRLIVATFHQASHLESPKTPPDLRDGLRQMLESDYRLLAVVPQRSDDETRIVTGEVARRMWRRAPLWKRGVRPWAAFVVWERRASDSGDARADLRSRAARAPAPPRPGRRWRSRAAGRSPRPRSRNGADRIRLRHRDSRSAGSRRWAPPDRRP